MNGNSIPLIFIIVRIGSKLSPSLFHEWTPNNFITITQTSMKHIVAYSFIGQMRYVIIGRIVGDSNDGYASMKTYMLFYISMNLGTFTYIISFALRIETNNIQDYARLYTKNLILALSLALYLLSLGGLPQLPGRPIFLGFITSVLSICYYPKIIKLLMIQRNPEITPHVETKSIYLRGLFPIPVNSFGPKNDTLEKSIESSNMIIALLFLPKEKNTLESCFLDPKKNDLIRKGHDWEFFDHFSLQNIINLNFRITFGNLNEALDLLSHACSS
ncbi:hypothetical protein Cgig2_020764 [Carnegiea gigantea]|uniref:NADH-plastoquinone oxidoreductase subunit 5 n=1 Tax=Carnegiea gigantea TaxID=171969 RepID=A0A9Q1QB97_9CARY|nr:hypothetical protein Cgig2_020764 [Carnegiea gigantea]